MQVQIFDFYDRITEDNQDVIVIFAMSLSGQKVRFEVHDTPYTIHVAVGKDFTSAQATLQCESLNAHLLKKKIYCKKTGCPCRGPEGSSTKYGVFRQECLHNRERLTEAVRKFEFVYQKGFEISEDENRRFLKIYLHRNCDVKDAALFMERSHELGNVLPEHRGVYGLSADACDAFIVERGVSSFEWIEIPLVPSARLTFDQIVRIKNQPVENATFYPLTFDIEVSSKKYRTEETLAAAYPVVVISSSFKGQFHSFMLSCDTCDAELYNSPADQEKCKSMAIEFMKEKCLQKGVFDEFEDEELTPEELEERKKAQAQAKNKAEEMEELLMNVLIGQVEYFSCEKEMLLAFSRFIRTSDPDYIQGYNSNYYDTPYLMRRALRLGIPIFGWLSREFKEPLIFRPYEKKTADGVRNEIIIDCPGRVFVDLMTLARSGLKLPQYKLKDVTEHFECGTKFDVGYEEIDDYFHGTSMERFILLKYCIIDVYLTETVGKRMDVLTKLIAKSRVLRVRAREALDSGHSYQLCMMVKAAIHGDFLMPFRNDLEVMRPAYKKINGYEKLWNAKINNDGYPGGYVLTPVVGIHRKPIVTFDFSSLYPSIILRYNICHSTLVPCNSVPREQCNVTPNGFWFLKPEIKMGVFPVLLRRLLTDRVAVKNKIKKLNKLIADQSRLPTDSEAKQLQMWDAEQLELKLSANAFYGQLATIFSEFSLLCGAVDICAYGRFHIQGVKKGLETCERFTHLKLSVDYGDTDSIMVQMKGVTDYKEAFVHARAIAEWINKESGLLSGSLSMALEKISILTVLLAKKRYIMLLIDEFTGRVHIKTSGMETRNMNVYNSKTIMRMVEMFMMEGKNIGFIQKYFAKRCNRIAQYQVRDITQLRCTASVAKPVEEYEEPLPAHIVVAKMMISAGEDVRGGDRLGYYLANVSTTANNKKSELVVPESMISQFTINAKEYLSQLEKDAIKNCRFFFDGSTLAQQEASISRAVKSKPIMVMPLKKPPSRVDDNNFHFAERRKITRKHKREVASGPMDLFVQTTSNRVVGSKQKQQAEPEVSTRNKKVKQMSLKEACFGNL